MAVKVVVLSSCFIFLKIAVILSHVHRTETESQSANVMFVAFLYNFFPAEGMQLLMKRLPIPSTLSVINFQETSGDNFILH